jgi:predicted transcriptional regulator
LVSEKEHSLRVYENRMLRRIFVPKRDEVTGGRRTYLYNLYFKKYYYKMIKSRRMKWARNVV